MTRSVYDPDSGEWGDEDGDLVDGMTNALFVLIFAGFLILLAVHGFRALGWVL